MRLFFEPDTVALIGASANEQRPGNQIFQNLQLCFGNKFYPVNPRIDRIDDKVCYSSILDVPAKIDVAVVFVPAQVVPAVLAQCAEKGIRRVIIESAGFAEVGQEGRALEDRCRAIAKDAGIRLWGPNCMGAINVPKRKILSFMPLWIWHGVFFPGSVSLVVQSGMLSAGFITHTLSRTPFGLSKVCSIGNKMDVDEIDLLHYFLDDPETEVIAMYLESLEKGRQFIELARATDKPIVVLKAGRTPFGMQAAVSHTSALAQDDRVLGSALRQANIIRVQAMSELMDVARCLSIATVRNTCNARVVVLTFSGGGGVVTADDIADSGMELASLTPQTLARLGEVFPEWMDPSNPVDLYPAFEKNGSSYTLKKTIEAVMEDPGVDAVYVHLFTAQAQENLWDYDHIAGLIQRYQKPVVAWLLGKVDSVSEISRQCERRGIPTVDDMRKGVRVLRALTLRR